MPRGRPKKIVVDGSVAVAEEVKVDEAPIAETVEPMKVATVIDYPPVPKPTPPAPVLTSEQSRIVKSREILNVPLTKEQEFYESPEGFIVIGERGKGRMWCRDADHGKGMWVNPKR